MKVKANGIEINYELLGKADSPVVAFSHSLASGMMMWEPQIKHLEPYYRLLLYDTRGHGGTDAPPGVYTLEMLGDDAVGLLDALGIDAVHWVGLSMGGMIGQCLALDHADRLRSLALCDTGSIIPEEAQAIWQERIDLVREKGIDAVVESTMEQRFTPSFLAENPPEVEAVRKQFLATPVAGYIGCCEAIRRMNYLDRLSEIKTPTLIMVGEADALTPVATSEAMHERIPDSRLVILPAAAHLSNIQQARAFNDALADFLKTPA